MSTLHVYREPAGWTAICDGSATLHAYKNGIPNLVKPTDLIYANSQWQTVCGVIG